MESTPPSLSSNASVADDQIKVLYVLYVMCVSTRKEHDKRMSTGRQRRRNAVWIGQ